MRNYIHILFLLAFFAFLFSSCEYLEDRFKDDGVLVTGKVGEILVVCDQSIWDSGIKKQLDSSLTRFIMPYFPDVATFQLIHKTPNHFEKGSKRYRNALFLNINSNHKGKSLVKKRYHVWAQDQLVVEITAKNQLELAQICENKLGVVHQYFDRFEWVRLIKKYERKNNSHIQKKIKNNFGISLSLPENSKIVTTRKNFYRLEFPSASRPIVFEGNGTQDPGTINSGILIYQYDYDGPSQLNLSSLLKARDTMLHYNVPHESEGYYMGTQYNKFVYPEIENTYNYSESIKGKEIRGMFQFKHNYKKNGTGGAFWAFNFVHPKTNKVICVSGYVDAPSTTSWTHSLREIQAVWKSVKIN